MNDYQALGWLCIILGFGPWDKLSNVGFAVLAVVFMLYGRGK